MDGKMQGKMTEEVATVVTDWSRDLMQQKEIEGAYLFGSVLNPQRFVPERSDVDLLLVLSRSLRTPLARANASRTILEYKKLLEATLEARLTSQRAGKPIVSTLLLTSFECENAIHKGRDHRFFETTSFLDLSQEEKKETRLGSSAAELFRRLYPSLIPTVQRAQDYRNRFLSVSANGSRPPGLADPWDDKSEALPKDLCRAAAPLRYFDHSFANGSEYDQPLGLVYIRELLRKRSPEAEQYKELHELVEIHRPGARAPMKPLLPEMQLLLWEILAHQAELLIGRGEAKRWTDIATPPPGMDMDSERSFLEAAAKPSLRIGRGSIECKLLPTSLWAEERRRHLYIDDPEAELRIELRMSDLSLPNNTLGSLLKEIEEALDAPSYPPAEIPQQAILREVYERLSEGSNGYPRVVALPTVETAHGIPGRPRMLVVHLGPSRYGVALVEEKRLNLPTANLLRSQHVLNSLAVRIAYVYKNADGTYWVECHRRKGGPNATYKGSWDVGAAGYIDPSRHTDPLDENRISPWQAAASEIAEELAISAECLPHRDHYFFFGVGRNDPTGQLDLLGYCLAAEPPDVNRSPTARVQMYDRCRLEPGAVAQFVAQKRWWVPTAVLTLVLTLEAFGYPNDFIDKAFAQWIGNVIFDP